MSDTERDVAGRLPGLHQLLAEVDELAVSVASSGELSTNGQRATVGLLASAWATYRAMRFLLERDQAEEARMLWRTLLDNAALLMWFSQNIDQLEELALRYFYTGANRSKRIVQLAAENGYDWAEQMEADRLDELGDIRAHASEEGITLRELPNTYQLLQDLTQEGLYYWHVHASQLIHSTPIGVSQRFRPASAEGGPFGIRLTSEPNQVVQVGILAAETFLGALQAAATLLGWDVERVRESGDVWARSCVRSFSTSWVALTTTPPGKREATSVRSIS